MISGKVHGSLAAINLKKNLFFVVEIFTETNHFCFVLTLGVCPLTFPARAREP
jgi:hypothetical protein